jgi:alkylation response protein AidB-like acyl-CoA dehydrogenase
MATVCAPVAFPLGYIFNNGSLRPLLIAGSQAQKVAFVKPLVDNKGYASWCMTEEGVGGSNLFAVKTQARRVPGGWVLNGHKVMAGDGTVASLFLVLADCWQDGRSVGLSVFCVPKGHGVVVGQNTASAA